MKRSKFTDAQIAFFLQQVNEGVSVAEVCRKTCLAEATFLRPAQEVRRADAVRAEAPEAA